MNQHVDITIIGAGAIGSAIARTLSRTTADILVIEKEADVAFGTSSRNSGVVHSGIHYTPGTNRAIHAVTGNRMMESLCSELQVPFIPTGKLTVAFTEEQIKKLHFLREQGSANGVPGMCLLNHEEMESLQPGIGGIAALHTPSTGIINPYEFTVALAESAYANDVQFTFNSELAAVQKCSGSDTGFNLTCRHYGPDGYTTEEIFTKVLINAAGLGSAAVAEMAGIDEYTIYPCRGEYYVLDKRLQGELNLLIYPVPGAHSSGLGIHLTNTIDGNILIGPSNEYIEESEDTATTLEVMEQLRSEGQHLLPSLQQTDFIRSFSGVRPKLAPPEEGGFRDFVIEKRDEVPGFINLVGIESPGLTSAPAIAERVRELVAACIPLQKKPEANWIAGRPVINGIHYPERRFADCSNEERQQLVQDNPDYGTIVCRCETVPLAEVKAAIARIFGPITVTGIKYRCRATTGRCQSGFCLQRITTILSEEFGQPLEEQSLKGYGSELFPGYLRVLHDTAGDSHEP